MESFERFQEPQLPPKYAFYSSWTEEDIFEIDYTHIQMVLNHFDMTYLEDYPNLYLLTDVLLLAKVFQNFRNLCFQDHGLDSARNYNYAGLSWQSALKIKDVKLDVFTAIDQHLVIGEGIRGRLVTPLAWKITAPANTVATWCIWVPTTYMDGWCCNLYPLLTYKN